MLTSRVGVRIATIAMMALAAICLCHSTLFADQRTGLLEFTNPDPHVVAGYQRITRELYPVGAPFMTISKEVFDDLYKVWPADMKAVASTASPQARRSMAYGRYGLLEAPWNNNGMPLGFVRDKKGRMQASCLLCHAGSVLGQTFVGRANSRLNLDTLYEDVVAYRKNFNRFDDLTFAEKFIYDQSVEKLGSTSSGGARGTFPVMDVITMFMSMRSPSLNRFPGMVVPRDYGPRPNSYLDLAPWWITAKKPRLFSDAFAPKNSRSPIMAGLSITVSGEIIRTKWAADFEDILQYINASRPPKYPGPINQDLAHLGRRQFGQYCIQCHGNSGYDHPSRVPIIPINKVGTDPNRLSSLPTEYKKQLKESWLGYYGESDVMIDPPKGYIAPPLDGIWASAPYFHNGSVPTLYHVLHPEERPAVWRVTDYDSYDYKRGGFVIEELKQVPPNLDRASRRDYFDAQDAVMGRTNVGHSFADRLTESEKEAILEYLKTL